MKSASFNSLCCSAWREIFSCNSNRAKGSIIVYGFLLLAITSSTGCKKNDAPADDPKVIFEEVWRVVDTRYALFDAKSANWDSLKQVYRAQVNATTTMIELQKLLDRMLSELKDGHLGLITQTDSLFYRGFYSGYPANFNLATVLHNYLHDNYTKKGAFLYTSVNGITYLYAGNFNDVPQGADWDSLRVTFSASRGVIIDIRNNSGGNSNNADKLIACLLSEQRLGKYEVFKKGPGHHDFADPLAHYLATDPALRFKGPVCVLTNRRCFSACNDFALYASGLSNVKLIGDQTGGGGGIPFDYLLTNGWKLRYTGSKTLSPDFKPIENGITPAIAIGITSADEVAGRDPILDKAIALLQ